MTLAMHVAANGNVGINNWNSRFPLSLGGSLGNTKLAVWDDGANDWTMGFGIQASQFRFHVGSHWDRFSFLDSPDGNELVTIRGTGNVGIGTTEPAAKMDIRGSDVPPGAPALLVGPSQGTEGLRAITALWSTFPNGSGDAAARRTADVVAGFAGAPEGTYAWGTEYLALHVGSNGLPNDAAALTSEKLRITADGSVGIGTTDPARKLHVSGSGFNGGSALFQSLDHANGISIAGAHIPGAFDVSFIGLEDSSDLTKTSYIGLTGPGAAPAGDLRFATGGSFERMRISSAGNVGIGTAAPTAKLEVAGTVKATSFVGDGSALTGISSGGLADNSITAAKLASEAASLAKVSGGAMVSAAGNVGIGTNTPQAKLDVNGDARVSGYLVVDAQHGDDGGNGLGLIFGGGSGGGVITSHSWPGYSGRGLSFWATWEPRMSITPYGDVGIGTAAPAAKLDVAGTIQATALNVGGVQVLASGSNLTINAQPVLRGQVQASQLATPGAPGPGQVLGYNGSSLVWQPAGGGSSVWSLNGSSAYYNSGFVGIGTTAPGYPLHVNASGAASSVLAALLEPNLAKAAFNQIILGRTPTASGCATITYHNALDYSCLSLGLYDSLDSLNIMAGGNVGIGTRNPQSKLEIDGQNALRMVGYEPFLTLVDNKNGGSAAAAIQNADGRLFFLPDGGHVQFQATDLWLGHPTRRGSPGRALVDEGTELHLNFDNDWANTIIGGANVSVCTLTIRGGCDLAEPFPMKEENIGKGSVVVIDEEHPGQLMLSARAYDTRVAGVISGANGINPGIALHQDGALDQGENVALTGRVYVKADASYGAIKPGDLLTTSDTPGHAMKVADHAKAQGAILGKAMSALPEGTGLVLVLVTLQ